MPKLTTQLAMLVFAGTLAAISPALAAPTMGAGTHPAIDCTLTANANDPFCVAQAGHNNRPGNNNGNNNNGANNNGGNNNAGNNQNGGSGQGQNNSGGQGFNHPDSNGFFNFGQHDRDQFHQTFHGFNFGVFATPNFSINLGVRVPHAYNLRPVPRSIYRQYPQFRGDLYFVTHGTVVIVSPSSHKIVALI